MIIKMNLILQCLNSTNGRNQGSNSTPPYNTVFCANLDSDPWNHLVRTFVKTCVLISNGCRGTRCKEWKFMILKRVAKDTSMMMMLPNDDVYSNLLNGKRQFLFGVTFLFLPVSYPLLFNVFKECLHTHDPAGHQRIESTSKKMVGSGKW